MSEAKLCRECKWSRLRKQYPEFVCDHPKMLANDATALASPENVGVNCHGTRIVQPRFIAWMFGECGKAGRLWEPKP